MSNARESTCDSVSTWGCNNESSTYTIATTQSLQGRQFSTLILVDGTPISTFISSSATDVTDTITTTTEPPDTTSHSSTTTISSTSTSQTDVPNDGPNVGAIVGGVVGGLAVVGLTVLGVLLIIHLRRRNRNQTTPHHPNSGPAPQVQPESGIQETHYVMASPTQTENRASLASPVKSQGQGFSPPPSVSPYALYPTTYAPPPQQVSGPGGVQMYELGEDNAGHYDGSI
ncbi:hypothetical protein B0J13DRAFT_520492 [Dactylonectria estremocensis]|uniref:Mid2 domain-containing protein n=1 Tax=Dactylonectria estremocensis TaxID=1079267 RepID=A0A9P9JBA2_9HYPO|nr:hypothetical protein B0J13DRAFT_520492 [Dactylonectria estremocensis]